MPRMADSPITTSPQLPASPEKARGPSSAVKKERTPMDRNAIPAAASQ